MQRQIRDFEEFEAANEVRYQPVLEEIRAEEEREAQQVNSLLCLSAHVGVSTFGGYWGGVMHIGVDGG